MKNIIVSGLFLALFGGIAMLSSGCHEEAAAPIFTISAPTDGQEYMLGDTIFVKGTITADVEMHGYAYELMRLSDSLVLLTSDVHDHGSSYSIDDFWVNNVTEHTDVQLTITAIIDHDGTEQSQTYQLHCHE